MSAGRSGWARSLSAAAIGALWLGVVPAARSGVAGNPPALPERLTGFAVSLGGIHRPSASATVNIDITRWSTDRERDHLLDVLKQKGPTALLTALQRTPRVGTIRTPDSLAYDLHFARETPWGDGGRRIVLVTDRPMHFWEVAHQARSVDYPFTVIEVRLDHAGRGEGKLSVATRSSLRGRPSCSRTSTRSRSCSSR